MPDMDMLSKGIGRLWQTPYNQMMQWKLGEQAIARRTLKALAKELGKHGNNPISYLNSAAARYSSMAEQGMFAPALDVSGEAIKLYHQLQQFDGHKDGLHLAYNTATNHLREMAGGEIFTNHQFTMTKGYIERVYISSYQEPALFRVQHQGVTHEQLNSRFNAIRPHIQDGIAFFASQIVRTGDVSKIRLPRRNRPHNLDSFLDESIKL